MQKLKWQNQILNEAAIKRIEQKIGELERVCGVELVLSILKASDPYPAATLRFTILFLLGVSYLVTYFFSFEHDTYIIIIQVILTILGIYLGKIPKLKKWVLSETETKREVKEKATELFAKLRVNETKNRIGALQLLSQQERRIELIIDSYLQEKISPEILSSIIKEMSVSFKHDEFEKGLIIAITMLETRIKELFPELINTKEFNEMKNSIIWGDFS
ncbi:MAG: TPM domain-containing protein [Bacteriovoracaceae bacterium]